MSPGDEIIKRITGPLEKMGRKAMRQAGPPLKRSIRRIVPMTGGDGHWPASRLALGFVVLLMTVVTHCEASLLPPANESTNVAIAARILPQEGLAMLDLRDSLRSKGVDQDWPHFADPCDSWNGVRCEDGHVVEIRFAGFRHELAADRKLHLSKAPTASSIDALQRLPFLRFLNGSGFCLSESLPVWLGDLASLEVVDFSSAYLTGSIPSSIGQLLNLKVLRLAKNSLTGVIPSALGDLRNLTLLDLSGNLLRGSIPSVLGDLTELEELNLASNGLQGVIPDRLEKLGALRRLLLAQNALVGDIPSQLANLLPLTLLDLSRNCLTGRIPANLGKLVHLTSLDLARNDFAGAIPWQITGCSRLETLDLSHNGLNGSLPASLSQLRSMVKLDLSSNRLSGKLPAELFQLADMEFMDLSDNFLSGPIPTAVSRLERLTLLDLSGNFLSGALPELLVSGFGTSRVVLVSGNCFSSPTLNKRSMLDCINFYQPQAKSYPPYISIVHHRKRLADVENPPDSPSDSSSSPAHVGAILGGVFAVLLLIVLVAVVVFYILQYERKAEARRRARRAAAAQKSYGKRAIARKALNIPSGRSINVARLGEEFSYAQLEHATAQFNLSNKIMAGHTGNLYKGILNGNVHVVVKKIDVSRFKDMYVSELEFFGRVSHSRMVPLLGHCLESEEEKLLVYKYMPNGDLAYALHRRDSPSRPEVVLQSLDWITRLKIAIGVAEGLEYLHHECSPPLVHRDVKASSILLDDKFEVRLGSLTDARIQQGENHSSRIGRLLRLSRSSDQLDANLPPATCSYDVFCFGKVLLELVSGKLGISGAIDPGADAWLDWALPLIDIHDREPLLKLMDKSLIVDEDLMEEVWATAIIAKSCLNPKSSRRPNMKHILRALENPQKVVRDDYSGPMKSRHSSYGSWNSALFGGWRHASSDGAFGFQGGSVREEHSFELNGRGQTSAAGEESRHRRQSGENFPGPGHAQGTQSHPSQLSHESES